MPGLLSRAWQVWQGWWFGPADPRRLAALRIGWGLLCLWAYLPMWGEVDALLGDPGIYPMDARNQDYEPYRLGIYANPLWELRDPALVRGAFAVGLLAMAAVVLGLGGRAVYALAWLSVVSMLNRTAVWTDGSDVLLRTFGFYMLFMPLNRTWSLDARLRAPAGPAPSSWPLRLFQLQVCVVYVRTGLVKAFQDQWQEGRSVYHALSTSYFWRFPMDPVLDSPVVQALAVVATYGTLVFEVGFPIVVLSRRLRPWWLLAGLCLHVGIAAFLGLGAFSEAMLWTYLAFVTLPGRRREGAW